LQPSVVLSSSALFMLVVSTSLSLSGCRACQKRTAFPASEDDPSVEPPPPLDDAKRVELKCTEARWPLPGETAVGSVAFIAKTSSQGSEGDHLVVTTVREGKASLSWRLGATHDLGTNAKGAPAPMLARGDGVAWLLHLPGEPASSQDTNSTEAKTSSATVLSKRKVDKVEPRVVRVLRAEPTAAPNESVRFTVPSETTGFALRAMKNSDGDSLLVVWEESRLLRARLYREEGDHRLTQIGTDISVPSGGLFVDDLQLAEVGSQVVASWLAGRPIADAGSFDPDEGPGLAAEQRTVWTAAIALQKDGPKLGKLQSLGESSPSIAEHQALVEEGVWCTYIHEPIPPSDEFERVRVMCLGGKAPAVRGKGFRAASSYGLSPTRALVTGEDHRVRLQNFAKSSDDAVQRIVPIKGKVLAVTPGGRIVTEASSRHRLPSEGVENDAKRSAALTVYDCAPLE
jgi:hypothetical protein